MDLTTFFLSISSAAWMALGAQIPGQDPEGQESKVDLEVARQNIELLELMQEKTRGNLTSEEDRLLSQLLFEVRMRYVEKSKGT